MSMENFISEALCKPNDYVSYWVSQRLAKMHPDKAVIEGETSLFDLEEYVRAGHCEVVSESSIHNQTTTEQMSKIVEEPPNYEADDDGEEEE